MGRRTFIFLIEAKRKVNVEIDFVTEFFVEIAELVEEFIVGSIHRIEPVVDSCKRTVDGDCTREVAFCFHDSILSIRCLIHYFLSITFSDQQHWNMDLIRYSIQYIFISHYFYFYK